MKWYFFALLGISSLFLSAILPRIVVGLKIDKIFKQKRNILYLLLIMILSLSYIPLESVAVIFFYFWIFFIELKKSKRVSLFCALYLFLAYDSIRFFFGSVLDRVSHIYSISILRAHVERFFETLLCLLIAVIIIDYIKINMELLELKEFFYYVNRAIFIFSVLSVLRISGIALKVIKSPFISEYDLVISLFVFIVYLLTILYLKEKQTRYLENKSLKQKENENRSLTQMVTELSSLYDEIRGFRHDFGGIVASLEPAIKEKNIDEVESIYQNVLIKMNKGLQKSDYSLFNANKIKDIAIKNVLMQKMIQAKNEKIPFSLEIIGNIPKIAVPMLDTIRILNILCDNALEAAIKADNPKVIVLVSSDKGITSVTIENTREEKYINQNEIWKKGYSTKGSNRGIGLYTVSNIIAKYESAELETMISYNTFTQKLYFKNKGDRS